jgi:pimeloyl-ACP methyl ester carboxylesterase
MTVLKFLKTLFLCFILSAKTFASNLPGIPDGWSDSFIYANGIRIHYYHAVPAPGKPVIVMVHGITDNGLCWTTLTWQLQYSYDIYMLDARGHGLSDPFTPNDNGETLVKDVVSFVQAMKFDKPILMGHSLGAATVMRLGADYPDLAKAIIMLDPMLGRFPNIPKTKPGEAKPTETAKPAQQNNPKPKSLSVKMLGTPEDLVAQNNYNFNDLVAKCHHDSPKWDSVDCQYWALSKKQYHGAYSDKDWQVLSGTVITGDALSKITAPALVLKADASPEVRKSNEEAAKVIQKGKLVHIDGAGHNLHHDNLKQTVKEINDFLSNL